MAGEKYQIDGFSFRSREDYERAKREKETVAYLKSGVRPGDNKGLLRVYNRSVTKESFRTVIGITYLQQLRRELVDSGIVSDEILAPVPVPAGAVLVSQPQAAAITATEEGDRWEQQAVYYKEAYEAARAGRIIKNVLIVVMAAVIAIMLLIAYFS